MRYYIVDSLRAVAIIFMVIFHIFLAFVGFGGYQFSKEIVFFLEILGSIARNTFILVAGISIVLASQKYTEKELSKKYFKRSLQVAFFALVATLVTYFANPDFFVVFGILHFFALSFFISSFFRIQKTFFLFFIGLGIYLFPLFVPFFYFPNNYFSFLGFYSNNFSSLDYFPLIPYFGLFLIGQAIGKILISKEFGKKILSIQKQKNIFSIIGKYSLEIYVIHGLLIYFVLGILVFLK